MEKVIEVLEKSLKGAFAAGGYDGKYARVTISNRPDLCEYQCNGAMAAAKEYKKAPAIIAGDVVEKLQEEKIFEEITVVNPGFINIKISPDFLAEYVTSMSKEEKLGLEPVKNPQTIVIDYGGANVAKPLHVGHLRPAIIGESIKRICKYVGHQVIGDAHLGDWGLPIGLIIRELQERQPELVYFDETYTGEYPKEAPFTVAELEEIYPAASAKSKEDESFRESAREAIAQLQQGRRGYHALWEHIIRVSVQDIKKIYDKLDVHFELWGKESDVQKYIPEMVDYMKEKGYAHISEGALVVDVKEETDTKEVPPCMILKSDGASLYDTTDLATIIERMRNYKPNQIIYVVDKRQDLYFERIFRCAKKTKLVQEDTELIFQGFGTMNGKDGKPFKTRDGGVMRLEMLMKDINQAVYEKIMENRTVSKEEALEIAKTVGLSALKYGDLSNQAAKDYIFDIERFTSFEGNTGPYILYTTVRIKSILNKYQENVGDDKAYGEAVLPASTASEKALMLELVQFNEMMENSCKELAVHKVCSYLYDLSNAFNHFYHETNIMAQEDKEKQASYIKLLRVTKKALETCMDVLGFDAPERM